MQYSLDEKKREVYTSRWKFTAGCLSSVEPLRGALSSFAFQGALAANVDFDLFRLVLKIKLAKKAEAKAIVLFLLVFLELALAMHGHRVVLDADINIFLFDARNFDLQRDVVLVLVYVNRRRERGGGQGFFPV